MPERARALKSMVVTRSPAQVIPEKAQVVALSVEHSPVPRAAARSQITDISDTGADEGNTEGPLEGPGEGALVGPVEGCVEGIRDGVDVGVTVGADKGTNDGVEDGTVEGAEVGLGVQGVAVPGANVLTELRQDA